MTLLYDASRHDPGVDNVSWHEHQQLKAEIARLRGELSRAVAREELLTSEEWRRDILAACAIYDNDQHEGNYGMGGGTPGDGANIVFEAIDRALAAPSFLSVAAQEVLEAAAQESLEEGRAQDRSTASLLRGGEGTVCTNALEDARVARRAAVHRYRALLEGRTGEEG